MALSAEVRKPRRAAFEIQDGAAIRHRREAAVRRVLDAAEKTLETLAVCAAQLQEDVDALRAEVES